MIWAVRAVGQPVSWHHSGNEAPSTWLFYHPLKYVFLPLHGQSQTQPIFMFQITGWRRSSMQVIPFKQVRQKLLRTFPLTSFWWELISRPPHRLLQAFLPTMLCTVFLVDRAPSSFPVAFIFPFPLLGVHGELGLLLNWLWEWEDNGNYGSRINKTWQPIINSWWLF